MQRQRTIVEYNPSAVLRKVKVNKFLKLINPSVPDAVPTEITPIRITHDGIHSDLNKNPYNAIDKNLKTQAIVVADGTTPAWLKLEFGQDQFIHKVLFYNRFYKGWFYPNNSCASTKEKFERCVDKSSNVEVDVYQGTTKVKSCGTLQLTYGPEQSDQIYTLVCNIMGDNVKLSKADGEIRIYEIVIIGTGKRLVLNSFINH